MVLLSSCLSLQADLQVLSSENFLITLDYSVRSDFARIKYLANNRSVMTLPLTEQEYLDFAASHEGVIFQSEQFSRTEQEERITIRSQLTFNNPEILEDLLACRVIWEGENPYSLNLSYDRGGEPSNEAVTFINGYCAGEMITINLGGPNNNQVSEEWPLREILLDPQAPNVTLEWEE